MQQRLLEQQKQAELNALQQDRQSSWSSLFRGNAQAPPVPSGKEVKEPTPVSLASIQAEQIKKEPVAKTASTMSAKIQQNTTQQPAVFKQTYSSSSKGSSQQQSAWGGSQASPSASAWGSTGNGSVSSSTTHPSKQSSAPQQSSNNASHNNESSSYSNANNNSSGGFWTDISDKKTSKNAKQQ